MQWKSGQFRTRKILKQLDGTYQAPLTLIWISYKITCISYKSHMYSLNEERGITQRGEVPLRTTLCFLFWDPDPNYIAMRITPEFNWHVTAPSLNSPAFFLPSMPAFRFRIQQFKLLSCMSPLINSSRSFHLFKCSFVLDYKMFNNW